MQIGSEIDIYGVGYKTMKWIKRIVLKPVSRFINRAFVCIWPTHSPLFSTPSLTSHTEAIVMKVTLWKRTEKGFIAQSSGWGPGLHSATAALCSAGWLTLLTWYNATWPLQLPVDRYEWGDLESGHWYFVKNVPPSWMTHIQEGQVRVWLGLRLHEGVGIRFFFVLNTGCSHEIFVHVEK